MTAHIKHIEKEYLKQNLNSNGARAETKINIWVSNQHIWVYIRPVCWMEKLTSTVIMNSQNFHRIEIVFQVQ